MRSRAPKCPQCVSKCAPELQNARARAKMRARAPKYLPAFPKGKRVCPNARTAAPTRVPKRARPSAKMPVRVPKCAPERQNGRARVQTYARALKCPPACPNGRPSAKMPARVPKWASARQNTRTRAQTRAWAPKCPPACPNALAPASPNARPYAQMHDFRK